MPALPVESLDAVRHPEVDRIHAPHAVGQRRRPVRGEGEVVALVVVVAHQLVGQDGPVALALAAHLFVLVAPDADQCLDRGARDVVEQVAVTVAGIGDVGECRRFLEEAPAVQVGRQRRGEGDRRDDLVAHESLHIVIASGAQGIAVLAVAIARQDDDAIEAAEMVADVVEAAIRRLAAQGLEVQQVHRVHAARGAHGARVAQRLEAAECQHHPRAGHHVALGEGQGLLDSLPPSTRTTWLLRSSRRLSGQEQAWSGSAPAPACRS
jgi:hypothetical protein